MGLEQGNILIADIHNLIDIEIEKEKLKGNLFFKNFQIPPDLRKIITLAFQNYTEKMNDVIVTNYFKKGDE